MAAHRARESDEYSRGVRVYGPVPGVRATGQAVGTAQPPDPKPGRVAWVGDRDARLPILTAYVNG